MMTKLKIKSGDTVRVIAGDHKGSEGKVLRVIIDKNRAIIEGVNMVSKHTKPSAKNPQGGIVTTITQKKMKKRTKNGKQAPKKQEE